MSYTDGNGFERNDSGQFINSGSLNHNNTSAQIAAGVAHYDTPQSAAHKLQQYYDLQNIPINEKYANGGNRESNLRLMAALGWWILCFVFAIGGVIAVVEVHDALRPVYPDAHTFVREDRAPPAVRESSRRNFEAAMLPLLKPGVPASAIWRHCARHDCSALGLAGAMALTPYAIDPAAFADQVCRLDSMLPSGAAVTARYAPGQIADQCDLVQTPQLQADIAHMEWRRSVAMWGSGVGIAIVALLSLYFFRPDHWKRPKAQK